MLNMYNIIIFQTIYPPTQKNEFVINLNIVKQTPVTVRRHLYISRMCSSFTTLILPFKKMQLIFYFELINVKIHQIKQFTFFCLVEYFNFSNTFSFCFDSLCTPVYIIHDACAFCINVMGIVFFYSTFIQQYRFIFARKIYIFV